MISLAINGMLALLLVTCILYCVRLEKRLRIFQSANGMLAETVTNLSRQTREADEAIKRFRAAVTECEAQIASPLANARSMSNKLDQQLEDAELVMDKIGRIVGAAAPPPNPAPVAQHAPGGAVRRRVGDLPERGGRSRFAGIG